MIVNKYTKGGSSSGGTGSVVSWRQDLSAGTQIAQITINGQSQSVFAPEGGGGDTTVIDFDAMSQAELAALFAEIYAKWSGSSINGEYIFLKSFGDYTPDNQGIRQMRLQFMTADGDSTLIFSTTTSNPYEDNKAVTWSFRLYSDGTYNVQTGGVRGVDKDIQNVGYFNTWNEALSFNKTTSAFTHYNGETTETITDGSGLGGSFYWFIVNAAQGGWGVGVPLLMFEVTDENGVTTTYQYPSMSKKPVSVTIGDIAYDTEVKFNYGEISLKMYLNGAPQVAGLTFIPKPNNVVLTQAQYDALVQAGTVDPNTIYTII